MRDMEAVERLSAILPKITSFFSLTSSLAIAYIVIANPRKKNKSTPYHRLILGMSVCDFLASFAWFFTTWPIPKDTGIYGAAGNQTSCSAQGFFTQFSLACVIYNLSVTIYYILVIIKKMKDAEIVKIEPYLHAMPIGIGVGVSTAALALGLLNPVGWDCWLGPSPMGCKESYMLEEGEVTDCVRGDNATLYTWYFFYAPLWLVILFITFSMLAIYKYIRDIDIRLHQYRHNAEHEQRKKFAKKAMLYVGAFYLTWLFPTILQTDLAIRGFSPDSLFMRVILVMTAIMVPIQGMLNLLVYINPDYVRYRNHNPNASCLCWFSVLFIELGFGEESGDENKRFSTMAFLRSTLRSSHTPTENKTTQQEKENTQQEKESAQHKKESGTQQRDGVTFVDENSS